MSNKRTIKISMLADHEYEAVNAFGNKVSIDMYDGEEKKHQSPMELLLSALGSCAVVDAVSMMKKKRKEVVDFTIDVEGERNDGIPAFYRTIHMHFTLVSSDAKEEELAKVIKLSVDKYCSVASSLKSEITYSSEVKRP
ncbi:OsmC family protein [Litoribacter ruber]|nr:MULTISPECIES: OsmC family protein [Litoribacter]